MALKALGVAAVIAESFGRIFYRNSINVGLPVVACPEISNRVQTGDRLIVDVESGLVEIEKSGESLQGEEKPGFLLDILKKGGLLEHLRQTALRKE